MPENTDNANNNRTQFIQEQYSQYHEMRRQMNSFSWQIPSVAILAILVFLGDGMTPKKDTLWMALPALPATGFLVLGAFTSVMLIFHIRNITVLRNIEKNVLTPLESSYGIKLNVYTWQFDKQLPWWQRIGSSVSLGIFLLVLAILCFVFSIYHWSLLIGG